MTEPAAERPEAIVTTEEAARQLARRKRSRTGHRASATRLMNQATTALEADERDVDQLSLTRQMLEEKVKTLKSLDEEIAELVPDEELEDEIQQADQHIERVYGVLTKLNKAVAPPRPTTPPGAPFTPPRPTVADTPPRPATPTSHTPRPSRSSTPDPTPERRTTDRVKLPKISLPHFRGDLMRWTPFWDSFNSAVHLNNRLSEIDKFNYLRSLLEGTAYDAIAGLALTAVNYGEAIEILTKRFGNKRLIISKHMESLLHIQAVTSDTHLKDLRKLYDQAEANIRSLKALGVEPVSYGAMLSSVLLSKLPPDLCLIVSRQVSADDLDMEMLLKTFEQELVARERANNSGTQVHSTRRNQAHGHSSTSAFLATTPSSYTCAFCEQSHSPTSCTVVTGAEARKKILRNSGRCFNCLRKNHLFRDCRSKSSCKNCRGRHHTSICGSSKEQPGTAESQPPKLNPRAEPYTPPEKTSLTAFSSPGGTVLLQTARTVIYNPLKSQLTVEIRMLFDSGSQNSYVTERVRKLLQLEPTGGQTLSIAAFGATKQQTQVCPIVSVGLCLRGYPDTTLSFHVVPTICKPLSSQPITASVEANEHFMSLGFADSAEGSACLPVDILIGCDHYWELVTGSICRSEKGPTAIETKFGWVLSGPADSDQHRSTHANVVTTHILRVDSQPTESTQLTEQLRSFWELEALGILEEEKTLYDEFTGTVTFQDGRYKVPLPWKDFHEPLPDNYLLCVKRLRGLLRRLSHEPDVLRQYNATIEEQLAKGIIEPVPTDTQNVVHYLPHHGVVRSDKSTTKLRVVYDASAKASGPSLDDCLYKGPKFQQLILDILIRFRAYRVALIADVEKAFLMISVDEKDRDVLRFLWIDDLAKKEPELRVYRFTRVVFGVSCSPFLLNATVRYHLERFLDSHEIVVKRLRQSTYVDDIISGADSTGEAFELYEQAKDIFRQGGFNLRKFVSSDHSLQERIDAIEQPRDSTATRLSPNVKEDLRVLGVTWDPKNDSLVFELSELSASADALQPTKRNVVSLIGRFYDPLGFLAPFTIKFKVLFQKLCQSKLGWDDNLPEELLKEWKCLLAALREATPLSLPRSYHYHVEGNSFSYTLCGFCDASTLSYAAVIYLVIESDVSREVKFLVSKTRVAPLQPQTIPRLELLSAFLLSRLVYTVAEGLSSTLPSLAVRCYTDSLVTLFWIQGTTKEWKPFVSNRVREIRQKVPPTLWSHCPGVTNPADLPSRGLTPLELSVSRIWTMGPEWLQSGFEPSTPSLVQNMPEECAVELRAKQSHTLVSAKPHVSLDSILDPTRFSTLSKLLRVTATILQAARKFKKLQSRKTDPSLITTEELQEAELLWVKSAQGTLTDLKTLTKQFNMFKDDKGVWRCGGRLANSEIPYAAKFPILVPRKHPITSLIVKQAHQRVLHNGAKETLAEIRSKYWIPKGRSFTRKIIHYCVICRKFEGTPFKAPKPPPLPECRVKETPAFSNTGVDFAGPLMIRTTLSSQSKKVWIALFTCYVTRAVHLDVVQDMSTPAFIRCLKRFAARRGVPARFISDNGKTFKAAAKYLDSVFKDSELREHLTGLGVTWQFNVERAPWWGGAFERMVRSTKRCLKKLIGRAHISFDELITALAEVEAVLNSRPLSYVSGEDLDEPITPSHLIMGRRILSLPDDASYVCDLDDEEFTLDSKQANSRVKHLNNILNHFWRRWRTEYLSTLREVHAHIMKRQGTDGSAPISVGDVVIVKDDHLPRGQWKLAVVQETLKGRDGLTRAAVVRVTASDRQHSTLKRPIQLLYPLEIHSETEAMSTKATSTEPSKETLSESSTETTPSARPVRAAAKRAAEVRRDWIAGLEDDD